MSCLAVIPESEVFSVGEYVWLYCCRTYHLTAGLIFRIACFGDVFRMSLTRSQSGFVFRPVYQVAPRGAIWPANQAKEDGTQ